MCDIGCFKDIVQPKRASLGSGVVEMHVVVGLNKDLQELDLSQVVKLRQSWMDQTPDRPTSNGPNTTVLHEERS
jgi:hypothetical protein